MTKERILTKINDKGGVRYAIQIRENKNSGFAIR